MWGFFRQWELIPLIFTIIWLAYCITSWILEDYLELKRRRERNLALIRHFLTYLDERIASLEARGARKSVLDRLHRIRDEDFRELRVLQSVLDGRKTTKFFLDEKDVGRTVDGIVDTVLAELPLDLTTEDEKTMEVEEEVNHRGAEEADRQLKADLPPDWRQRRRAVWSRDRQTCRRCGVDLSLDEAHIHHIRSRREGGDHEISNLITLCKRCHDYMPGHSLMPRPRYYAVDTEKGLIHSPRCLHAREARAVYGNYDKARNEGYEACPVCKPYRAKSKPGTESGEAPEKKNRRARKRKKPSQSG